MTTKWVAAPAVTLTAALPAVIVAVTESAAVKVCGPAVLRIAAKMPVPSVRVASAGNCAWPSLLVKCTLPL